MEDRGCYLEFAGPQYSALNEVREVMHLNDMRQSKNHTHICRHMRLSTTLGQRSKMCFECGRLAYACLIFWFVVLHFHRHLDIAREVAECERYTDIAMKQLPARPVLFLDGVLTFLHPDALSPWHVNSKVNTSSDNF